MKSFHDDEEAAIAYLDTRELCKAGKVEGLQGANLTRARILAIKTVTKTTKKKTRKDQDDLA